MLRKGVLFTVLVFCLFFITSGITHAQVVINEIGILGSPDWIELYAYEDVDISGWYIDDDNTSSNVFTFPAGTVVGPSSTKFITENVSDRFNNSGDIVRLYKGDGTLIEEISYGNKGGVCLPVSASGSIGKTTDGGNYPERFSTSTYNISNSTGVLDPCPSPTPIPTNTPTNTPAPSSTPTNTPAPTNTPTQTPTSTPKPSVTPTKKPTPTPKDYTTENQELSSAADVSQFRYDSGEEDKENVKEVLGIADEEKENVSPFAYVLLGLGVVFVGISIFLYVKNKKQ